MRGNTGITDVAPNLPLTSGPEEAPALRTCQTAESGRAGSLRNCCRSPYGPPKICNGYRGNGTVVNRLTPVTQERNEETVCQVRALCSNLFKSFLQQTHLYYQESFCFTYYIFSVHINTKSIIKYTSEYQIHVHLLFVLVFYTIYQNEM